MKRNNCPKWLVIIAFACVILPNIQTADAQQCTLLAQGDADCDGSITISDFEIFRREFTGEQTTVQSDFDSDGTISIADFEIWRQGFFNTSKIWYISPSGDDKNDGSKSSPLKTIAKAISIVSAGEEIHLLPGTYREQVSITNKSGSQTKPIVIVGESSDTAKYPVIDGGDSASTNTADWAGGKPAFTITGSGWIVLERMKIVHSSPASVFIDNSSYIVIRRLVMDYHRYGVLNRNNSNHILIEHNDIFQSYGDQPWSSIKGSKWEGGAYTSFGGGGMITLRYNYIHDSFNGVYLYRNTRTGPHMDSNVWIYRNRFEKILDDPYEPDVSYAFNNHFFNNTLINTHRMVSMASGSTSLQDSNLGPIYIYNNTQVTTYDITKEAATRSSLNSAWKIELNTNWYVNGIYMFNNSIDLSQPVNGTGAHILNGDGKVNNWHQLNNAFRTKLPVFKGSPTFNNSDADYDISNTSLNYNEAHGLQNTEPGFVDSVQGNFQLKPDATARGKSKAVTFSVGFTDRTVIAQGADIGAYQFGENDLRRSPEPKYEVPPGGEPANFPVNLPWPSDSRGGVNPPSGP